MISDRFNLSAAEELDPWAGRLEQPRELLSSSGEPRRGATALAIRYISLHGTGYSRPGGAPWPSDAGAVIKRRP